MGKGLSSQEVVGKNCKVGTVKGTWGLSKMNSTVSLQVPQQSLAPVLKTSSATHCESFAYFLSVSSVTALQEHMYITRSLFVYWSGWWGTIPRPPVWQTGVLPTELQPHCCIYVKA